MTTLQVFFLTFKKKLSKQILELVYMRCPNPIEHRTNYCSIVFFGKCETKAHTFYPSLAIDANILRDKLGPKNIVIVNSYSLPNQFPEYQDIKNAAQKFGLAWGIDWNISSTPYMPRDAIHFEISGSTKDALPPYIQNPGPLDPWNLRNI